MNLVVNTIAAPTLHFYQLDGMYISNEGIIIDYQKQWLDSYYLDLYRKENTWL